MKENDGDSNKLVLKENKRNSYDAVISSDGGELSWEKVNMDGKRKDLEDIIYNFTKDEEQEIEKAMVDELREFQGAQFREMKQTYHLQEDEVKVLVFKEDNLLENNKQSPAADVNNNFDSFDSYNANRQNKVKRMILLMEDDVYEDEEDEEEQRLHVREGKVTRAKEKNRDNLIASDIDRPREPSEIMHPLEDVSDTQFRNLDNAANLNGRKVSVSKFRSKRLQDKIKTESEDRVHLKDKKVVLNIEDYEKRHLQHDDFILEGDLDPSDEKQMDRVYKDLKQLHPYVVENEEVKSLPFCAKTGWFCCGKANSKSDLEKLGIGMVCYFKVLKVFIICFALMCLLNLPLYYIYFHNQNEKKVVNYRDALYKLTIGSIAASVYNCIVFPVGSIATKPSQQFRLDCLDTNITSIVGFGTSTNLQKEVENIGDCANFTTAKTLWIDSACDLTTYARNKSQQCVNQYNCEFNLDLNYVRSHCNHAANSTLNFFLKYECHDNWIQIGLKDTYMTRGNFGFLIVGVDLASMTVLLICMFVITSSQRRNEQTFKEKYILISDYTLHVQNVPLQVRNIYTELNLLVKHFREALRHDETLNHSKDSVLKMLEHNSNYSDLYADSTSVINLKGVQKSFIYDINYPLFTTYKLNDIMAYNECKRSKLMTERKLTHPAQPADTLQKGKLEKKLEALKKKMKKLKERIRSRDELEVVKEVYLTFRNQKIANFFYEAYKKNGCIRCCYICSCQYHKIKHFYYNNKWLDITYTKDEPSNIHWQNLTYNRCKRCLRSTASIIIAFFVMLISFAVVISVKYSQEIVAEKYNPNINCAYITTGINLVIAEYAAEPSAANNKIYTHCFCLNYLDSNSYSLTEDYTAPGTSISPCAAWLSAFVQYNSISSLISIVVPVVGSLLILVMKWLSHFEKNKTLTEELTSSMWKMFVLQFVNTGLVILLVNVAIQPVKNWWTNFPMFTGNYTDLDPSWYSDVGVTIVFTMYVNVVVPHLSALVEMTLVYLRRCCDGGCNKGRFTKLTSKKDYFELYMGPQFEIDVRYSQILTTIFVSLIYSSGMPALYFSVLCYLILNYFVDKYLVLRFYRIPPKYDLYLANVFNIFIFSALIIHFCFGIWIYGNTSLLENNSNTFLNSLSTQIKALIKSNDPFVINLVDRLTMAHNVICLCFLLLLILIFLFRFTFYSFLKLICCGAKRKVYLENKNMEIGLAIPMKSLYKSYELRKIQMLKMMKEIGSSTSRRHKSSENGTRTNTGNISYLKNYFQSGINYDREFLEYKLEKNAKTALQGLDNDFDNQIQTLIEKYEFKETEIITGDVSYNIAYIPEFETVAYYEYIKNILK